MKTKRTTKKKPTANTLDNKSGPATAAGVAERLWERIIALGVNHGSLCETLRVFKQGVDALADRMNRAGLADLRVHLGGLADRVAVLENSSTQVCRLASGSPRVERGDPIVIDTPEPVIPKGWKRVTKDKATRKDGKCRALYKNSHLGEWHADWYACHDADRFYIYLARDYPKLPTNVTAAGWVACEWDEAQEMGYGERAGVWIVVNRRVVGWAKGETDITWVKKEPKK